MLTIAKRFPREKLLIGGAVAFIAGFSGMLGLLVHNNINLAGFAAPVSSVASETRSNEQSSSQTNKNTETQAQTNTAASNESTQATWGTAVSTQPSVTPAPSNNSVSNDEPAPAQPTPTTQTPTTEPTVPSVVPDVTEETPDPILNLNVDLGILQTSLEL